jgi:multicomponent K+:H+ antiporter subunit E
VKHVLPYPLLTVALVLMWLLLNSFNVGHLILGTIVALVAARAMAALEPSLPRIRRWDIVLRLAVVVSVDVIRSNVAVARIVLSGARRERRSGFVEIDLALGDRTALACSCTSSTSSATTNGATSSMADTLRC